MLIALDWFFHVLHIGLVLFNLFGWAVPKWRRVHLISLGVVWASWLLLGLYMGHLGYCPLTDWHWQIKRQLGEYLLPASYIEYLYWAAGGRDVLDALLSNLIAGVMLAVTALSLAIYWRKDRKSL